MFFLKFKSPFHSMGLPDLTVHRRIQTRVGIKKIPNSQGFYAHLRDSGTTYVKSQYLLVHEKGKTTDLI